MNCICGNNKFRDFNEPGIIINSKGEAEDKVISLKECLNSECNIVMQTDLPFSNIADYINYYKNYYPPTKSKYSKKDYVHDRKLAVIRCNEYGLNKQTKAKILDIGSGSGAFVDECRSREVEAFGCEISLYDYGKEDKYIYRNRFEDINFPTDYFNLITCHDVIEHVLDPINFLKEAFRVTKQIGQCIIDIPRHGYEKHKKIYEHIWFFTDEQFKKLLEDTGFIIDEIKHPIETKTVFYLTKPIQKRTKILLPPGIGDSFWSIIKLQSFIKQKNIGIPDVHVVCNRDRHDGHKRAFPFIQMFPFLNSTGVHFENTNNPKLKKIWKLAYAKAGQTIFRNIHGCDYFISFNGHLKYGKQLHKVNPELECNWFPPMFVSLEQDRYKEEAIKKYGKYIVFYFVFHGTYKYWSNQFPIENVIHYIRDIIDKTGYIPVFVGAPWDLKQSDIKAVKRNIPNHIDLTGKTSLEQVFGLIRGSQLFVGYPSGLTIMGAMLKAKTLIIWNDYYNRNFAWHCVAPEIRNNTYFALNTENLKVDDVTAKSMEIITGEAFKINEKKESKKNKHKPIILDEPYRQKTKKNNIPINPDRLIDKSIAIVCVLKSGGDYDLDYVKRLRNMVNRHTSKNYDFYCFTDTIIDSSICKSIRLINNYNRWWSKIELFRKGLIEAKRLVYFDLDTVILDNIENIIESNSNFVALKPWNPKNRSNGLCASGMMSWINNGMFNFIYKQFRAVDIVKYSRGDQEYISHMLNKKNVHPIFFQDEKEGIYSYKRNCRRFLPGNAKIVCFHGRPRPRDTNVKWVIDNWY
jgi:ubiquinone/menaquinone biosynthesis C-methylase UbiE